jgi:hypothetical protein
MQNKARAKIMTKKDYIVIAKCLNDNEPEIKEVQKRQLLNDIFCSLVAELKKDNYKFDYSKFEKAVYKK